MKGWSCIEDRESLPISRERIELCPTSVKTSAGEVCWWLDRSRQRTEQMHEADNWCPVIQKLLLLGALPPLCAVRKDNHRDCLPEYSLTSICLLLLEDLGACCDENQGSSGLS